MHQLQHESASRSGKADVWFGPLTTLLTSDPVSVVVCKPSKL